MHENHPSRAQQPRVRTLSLSAVAALGLFATGACDNHIPTAPAQNVPRASALSSPNSALASVDTIARLLAIATSDPSIRQQLHDDFRDSPFDEHAIEFRSYLQGPRGGLVLIRAAGLTGVSVPQFLATLARAGNLEIAMSRPVDRLQWDGTTPVIVASTASTPAELATSRLPPDAFDATGNPVALPVYDFVHAPLLIVRPVKAAFGANPEATRAASPHQNRSVISTRTEEAQHYRTVDLALGAGLHDDCPPNTDLCDPGSPGPEPLGGYQLPAQFTQYYCLGIQPSIGPGEDVDHDGVRDDCEAALAIAFTPQLMYASTDPAMAMEPYYSVAYRQPDAPGFGYPSVIKIFYALSYYRDPGSPVGSLDAHDGDSEFIIVGLHSPGDSYWKLDYETLSAHWGAGIADHTATYGTDVIEWADTPLGRPRVWISWGKHANYRSRDVCISEWNDFCGYEYTYGSLTPFIPANANLGNYWAGTGDGREITSNYSRNNQYPALETGWWNDAPYDPLTSYFGGWHINTDQAKATAYGVMLNSFGF